MTNILFVGPKSPPVSGYSRIVSTLFDVLKIEIGGVEFLSNAPSKLGGGVTQVFFGS